MGDLVDFRRRYSTASARARHWPCLSCRHYFADDPEGDEAGWCVRKDDAASFEGWDGEPCESWRRRLDDGETPCECCANFNGDGVDCGAKGPKRIRTDGRGCEGFVDSEPACERCLRWVLTRPAPTGRCVAGLDEEWAEGCEAWSDRLGRGTCSTCHWWTAPPPDPEPGDVAGWCSKKSIPIGPLAGDTCRDRQPSGDPRPEFKRGAKDPLKPPDARKAAAAMRGRALRDRIGVDLDGIEAAISEPHAYKGRCAVRQLTTTDREHCDAFDLVALARGRLERDRACADCKHWEHQDTSDAEKATHACRIVAAKGAANVPPDPDPRTLAMVARLGREANGPGFLPGFVLDAAVRAAASLGRETTLEDGCRRAVEALMRMRDKVNAARFRYTAVKALKAAARSGSVDSVAGRVW